jgi:hypothetical protein
VEIEPDPRFGRSCTPSVQQQVGLDAWNRMARDEIDRACEVAQDAFGPLPSARDGANSPPS